MGSGTGTDGRLLTVEARRQRNRGEMTVAILETARATMRERGVAAVNLNEIARRVGVTTPAIYGYFANKEALYDALYREGVRIFREGEEEVWRTTGPDWGRVLAWFEVRASLARAHPDLYHLVFEASVPGFDPSEESRREIRELLDAATRGLTEVVEAGAIDPNMAPEMMVDVLLSVRRGLVAGQVGKRAALLSASGRVVDLTPEVLEVFRKAWTPADSPATKG